MLAEHLKTNLDRERERKLMEKLLEIVNDRNAIIDGLDEDRLRWVFKQEKKRRQLSLLYIKAMV